MLIGIEGIKVLVWEHSNENKSLLSIWEVFSAYFPKMQISHGKNENYAMRNFKVIWFLFI